MRVRPIHEGNSGSGTARCATTGRSIENGIVGFRELPFENLRVTGGAVVIFKLLLYIYVVLRPVLSKGEGFSKHE